MTSTDVSPRNATDLLAMRAAQAPTHIAFDVPIPGAPITDPWRKVTTAEFERSVIELAKGLVSVGIQPGDAIVIMAPTRYEWALTDFACWYAGAVVVPVYGTSAQAQVDAIVADAEIRLGFAGSAHHAQVLQAALESTTAQASAQAPHLGVWTMDPGPERDLAALVNEGHDIPQATIDQRRLEAGPDSVATIVYTSGTTAAPRGALITHGNFVEKVQAVADAYGEVVHEAGSTIIFLPLAHVLARGLQLICISKGMRIAHLSDPKEVVLALPALTPTFLVVVPRVLEKIQARAAAAAADKHLGAVWAVARRTAIDWGQYQEDIDAAGGSDAPGAPSASIGLRMRHKVFDRLFYSRLRAVVGGHIDYLLSGAATLERNLSLFFRGLGVPVIEGYGLTETTAPLTGNLPGSIRSGTVGVALPGCDVRISDQGEVLARGVGVFPGYRHESDTRQAFVDGWFRTGDLGELDDQGRLRLNGRIKDIIVTSGGKNIAPAQWERRVEREPLIAHAVMVGEARAYPAAIIIVDAEAVGNRLDSWPQGGDVMLLGQQWIRETVEQAIARANAQVSRSEQVRRFDVIAIDPGATSDFLTPTMKLKRGALLEAIPELIDGLYEDTGAGR